MPEPTYIEQQATLAEATFGKDVPRGAMTPERQYRREKAEAIRKKRAENQSEQSVIESFAPHPPPTEGRVSQVNGENIGTKRKGDRMVEVVNPDGTRVLKKYDGPDAGDRDYDGDTRGAELRKKADQKAKLAREVLERGYDGLVDTRDGLTKTQKQDMLVKEMLEAAKSWPLARAVLESYGSETDPGAIAARKELMEARLRDPRFVKKLSEHFQELYEGDGALLQDLVTEAQDAYDRAEQQAKLKNDELVKITAQLDEINGALRVFNPGGAKYDDLIVLRGSSESWDRLLSDHEIKLTAAKTRVDQLLPQASRKEGGTPTIVQGGRNGTPYEVTVGGEWVPNPDIVREIANANGEISRLQGEISTIVSNKAKLKGLEDEKLKLEKEKRELEDRETPLIEQVSNLDLAKGVAKRKLDIARATRNTEEEQFVNKVEGMFLEAGRRSVKEDVQLNEAAQKKAIEKAAGEAGERDEEQLEKCMNNDWREPVQVGTFRKRTVYRVDKDEMKAVYDRLVQERGMDWYVKNSLETHLRSLRNQFGEDSQQYREERKRLDDKFKDTAFMKGLEAKAQERFYKNYLETGHKLKKEDISVLVETDAGLVAIDAALEKNKAVADKIEELQRKSLFSGSRSEFLKKAAKDPRTYGTVAGLIAFLLGSPFLYAGAVAAGSVVGPAYMGAVKAVV